MKSTIPHIGCNISETAKIRGLTKIFSNSEGMFRNGQNVDTSIAPPEKMTDVQLFDKITAIPFPSRCCCLCLGYI